MPPNHRRHRRRRRKPRNGEKISTTHPTIVIPGLQGTALYNHYPTEPAATWSLWEAFQKQFFTVDFASVALSASGGDFHDEVVTSPHHALPFPYSPLVGALRGKLKPPTYVFRYDWRRSLTHSARLLTLFLEDLLAKPMHSVPGLWDGKFNFVCHSFGGLVFRGLLSLIDHKDLVNRVVFIGTPHRGSLDAVESLIRGETAFFGGRKEMRKLARTFPSIYELLPTYSGALIDPEGHPLTAFDVGNWQENLVDQGKPFRITQSYLDRAKSALAAAPMPTDILEPEKILSIIGLEHNSTLSQIPVSDRQESDNWYDFDGASRSLGDEVVLAESAMLPGTDYIWLDRARISYFTLGLLTSLHAAIPAIDETQSIIARFLSGTTGIDLLPKSLPAQHFVAG